MQILFIYLSNNYIFQNDTPINFGGKYIINYSKQQEELTIKENPYYVPNFFRVVSKDNVATISNVTGIVGENGSGKTSILNFTKNILTRGISCAPIVGQKIKEIKL